MKNDVPKVVKIHDVEIDQEYMQWLGEIKARYRNAQIKAAVRVNVEQLLFNWQLGRDLVTRKAEERWGSGIVEQVSLVQNSNNLLENCSVQWSLKIRAWTCRDCLCVFHGGITFKYYPSARISRRLSSILSTALPRAGAARL